MDNETARLLGGFIGFSISVVVLWAIASAIWSKRSKGAIFAVVLLVRLAILGAQEVYKSDAEAARRREADLQLRLAIEAQQQREREAQRAQREAMDRAGEEAMRRLGQRPAVGQQQQRRQGPASPSSPPQADPTARYWPSDPFPVQPRYGGSAQQSPPSAGDRPTPDYDYLDKVQKAPLPGATASAAPALP